MGNKKSNAAKPHYFPVLYMNKDFIRTKTAESTNVYRAPIKLLKSDKIVKPNSTLKKEDYCSMFN
jgi:hypothetical protein